MSRTWQQVSEDPRNALHRYINPGYGGQLIGPGPSQPGLTEGEKAQIAKTLETLMVDAETGGKKGQKLAQFSQIPPDVLWELAEHFGKGLAKYPDDEAGKPNWQRGYSWRLSVDAMERHFNAWQRGEDEDPETGSSHLVCAIWHLMVLRWFQLHNAGTDYR